MRFEKKRCDALWCILLYVAGFDKITMPGAVDKSTEGALFIS